MGDILWFSSPIYLIPTFRVFSRYHQRQTTACISEKEKTNMSEARVKRVLAAMEEQGLEQVLVTDPMSIYYLIEVWNEPFERFYGLLLKTNGEHVFFLNRLFRIREDTGLKIVWYTDTDDVPSMVAAYTDHGKILGVDKDLMASVLLPLMELGAASGYVNASEVVDLTRGVKAPDEQEKMRVASRINDQAMAKFKTLIHEGVTERQVANQMLHIYLDLGAEGYSFPPIVSFGANAADPHHEPDDTVVRPGDCVLFDVGCKKDGYCSDMTRTFYYKEVSEYCRSLYETVRKASEAAEEKIAPGVVLKDIDDSARSIITEAGYGQYFNHRLGHFIGMTPHEYGSVSKTNTWEAQPGMIFSIEPGIYLAGDTGVRIEDLVLVTEDGVERLNRFPKELQIIE